MKTKGIILAIIAALVAGVGTGSGATNEVSGLLQKGLFEEEANQNLDAAILAYREVVSQTDKNHQFAATAIFRLGECYRKLGKTNEANAEYQRILQEFPNRAELVKLSRQQLAKAGEPAQSTTATAEQIAEIKKLSPEKQRVAVQQMFPNPVLDALMQKMNKTETELAGLKANLGDRHPDVTAKEAVLKTIHQQIDDQVEVVLARGTGAAGVKKEGLEEVLPEQDSMRHTEAEAIKRLQQTIKDSPDLINAHDPYGRTPLHEAVKGNMLKVAGFLLENHADTEQRDNSGVTPLILAAESDYKEMVALLLKGGADANARRIGDGYSALHYAAKLGYNAVAETLLEHGATVDLAGGGGKTPLMITAGAGFKKVAETLLAKGADINAKDQNGKTALFGAVTAGNRANVELFMAKGANINAADNEGKTALFAAIETGSRAMVELLLANKANINAQDNDGTTPLMSSILGEHADIVNVLLQHGADAKIKKNGHTRFAPSGWTALHFAVDKNQLEAVKALLDGGAEINAVADVMATVDLTRNASGSTWHEFTPLMLAACENHKDIVQTLLDHGADVNHKNAKGETALAVAAGQGQKESIELLLAHNADKTGLNLKDRDGRTALIRTVCSDADPDWAEFLIEHGADVNSQESKNGGPTGWTALSHAVALNRTNLVASLLDKGADVNAVCEFSAGIRYTPLMIAIIGEKPGIERLLLEHKANVNFTNAEGMTPLRLALYQKSHQSINLLLDYKADVNAADGEGRSALYWAVSSKDEELVKLLLDRGAEVNARNKDGKTPLHLAVEEQSKPIAELLLAHGADVNARDNDGNTPLDTEIKAETETGRPPGFGRPGGNGLPGAPLDYQWSFNGSKEYEASKAAMEALLRQRGAVAEVDVATVRVMRSGKVPPQVVFRKDPASYNHYTLYEFILKTYANLVVTLQHEGIYSGQYGRDLFAFPDFGKVKIIHLAEKGRTNTEAMDLEKALAAGDCSADKELKWGDIVEIPEMDHKVTEGYLGLTQMEREALAKCVGREVTITVKGQTTILKLAEEEGGFPGGVVTLSFGSSGPSPLPAQPQRAKPPATTSAVETPKVDLATFWLNDVVHGANVLLASSDLTRVKVKRKGTEMVFNLEKMVGGADLWLENGDAIEVPEKVAQ